MYKISIDGKESIVRKPTFIKKQKNGVIISCKEEEAQGIVSLDNTQNWAIKGKGLEEELSTTIELYPITQEEYLIELNAKLDEVLETQAVQDEILAEMLLNSLEV